ncbi:MAG: hypothetical protein QW350_05800 [Candidatus Aenigmatarchaeota archaeon]|jgi:hypothetical protein
MTERFDRNIQNFFKFLTKVVEESTNSEINNDLNDYIQEYDKKGPGKKFLSSFKKVYSKYSEEIEQKTDSWLTKNKVVFEGKKGKIHASEIYQLCQEIKRTYEDKLKDFPEETKKNYKQFKYPKIFLLHLYRIFSEFSEPLNEYVKELEKELKEDQDNMQEMLKSQLPSMNNPLQNVNFFQIISQVANSEATKKLLTNIVKKINVDDCNTTEGLVSQVFKTTTDPELIQNFEEVFKSALQVNEHILAKK